MFKSDAKLFQNILGGKTDIVKLDRWSLELQCRNINVEHIPGSENKAVNCLSGLPYITRKRNDNPLHDVPINSVTLEERNVACPLCEVNLTDTIAQQKIDKHCIRIGKLMKDTNSEFPDRDLYAYDKGLLYHINKENGKEYKAVLVPKVLVPTVLNEMNDHFGHFGIGKAYSHIKG